MAVTLSAARGRGAVRVVSRPMPGHAATAGPLTFRVIATIAAVGVVARGGADPAPGVGLDPGLSRLSLDGAAPDAGTAGPSRRAFGEAGAWRLSVGTGLADDFFGTVDANWGTLGLSIFLVPAVEAGVEAGVWTFFQEGPNRSGASATLAFRFHLRRNAGWDAGERRWSLYADLGIGLLASTGAVPEGGTDVNFMPRAGVGVAARVGSDVWLIAGARWHHISNARVQGQFDNPSRDGLMLHAALSFPVR